jgi:hypothetical protein
VQEQKSEEAGRNSCFFTKGENYAKRILSLSAEFHALIVAHST